MKITIRPSGIIKRCCWDAYVYYVLKSDKEGQKLLEADEEFEISEKDALVMGLLKVIETDNLIHKFNGYIVEVLMNKSMGRKELMIRKKTFDLAFDKFLNKFPDYWEPNENWIKSLADLVEYIDIMKEKISNLEVTEVTERNMTFETYSSNAIRKLLKFNYY